MSGLDLDSVADELYSLPRDEFTAARNAAAKRAREQGRGELAEQIGALRRPSTAAWLANLVAREQPDEVRALVELGDGLREAQHRLQGEALRRMSQQRHELVHALVQQARGLARSAGHPASDAVARELENTFTAAVNSSVAARALAGGQLTSALDPTDADAVGGPPSGTRGVGSSRRDHGEGDHRTRGRDERLRRDLERARREAAKADTAHGAAERALAEAEQAADNAAGQVRELRARLDAAGHDEQEARRRARSVQRDVTAADRAAREARRRVDDLEHRLAREQSR